jgi:hypothetical protein
MVSKFLYRWISSSFVRLSKDIFLGSISAELGVAHLRVKKSINICPYISALIKNDELQFVFLSFEVIMQIDLFMI